MRGSSPRMTRDVFRYGPRLCSAPLRKGYALRCVRGMWRDLPFLRGHRLDQLAGEYRVAARLAVRRAALRFERHGVGRVLHDVRVVGGKRRPRGKIAVA